MTAPIRIGEINSYSSPTLLGFTVPYRTGIAFAVERINAAGGILGRPVEIIHRDDGFVQQRAADHALDLIRTQKVDLLLGTFNSDVALAVSRVATAEKTLFLAGEPRSDALTWSEGSRYVFRLRTCQSMMSAMLIDMVADLPHHRWGIISATYPAAQRFSGLFQTLLSARRPDVEWIGQADFDMDGSDPSATLDWIEREKPEAVFGAVLGPYMLAFAREGNRRGTFANCLIVNPLAGEPEYMLPLGADTPENWMVLGYPSEEDMRPENQAFCADYRAYAGEAPTLGSLLGVLLIDTLKAAIERAGSVEIEAMVDALEGLDLATPMGPLRIRAGDHQATMGGWVGKLTCRDGAAAMTDWTFLDGAAYLPSEAEGASRRPAGA